MTTPSENRAIRSSIALVILGTILGAIFSFWDPFSISSKTRDAMSDFYVNTLAGTDVVRKGPPIVTVLLTDGDLRGMNSTWPLGHAQQASVLRAIQIASPKAVLVDFFFLDVRDEVESVRLIGQLEALACETKLFLIAPPNQAIGEHSIWTEFYARQAQASESKLCKITLVNANRIESHMDRLYPMFPENEPSPAQALFKELSGDMSTIKSEGFLDDSAFEIEWLITPKSDCQLNAANQIGSPEARQACRRVFRSPVLRFCAWFISGLGADLTQYSVPDLKLTEITPTTTFAVSELNSRESPAIKSMRDAVVFYGASISGLDDSVANPLFRAEFRAGVPGVYWHAVALQTLLNTNGHPMRRLSGWLPRIILVVCVMVLTGLFFVSSRALFQKTLSTGLHASASCLLSFVFLMVATSQIGISPSEWIDLPFLFAAGLAAATSALAFANQLRMRFEDTGS